MEDLAWQYPAEPVERAALRFCEATAKWRGKPELETVRVFRFNAGAISLIMFRGSCISVRRNRPRACLSSPSSILIQQVPLYTTQWHQRTTPFLAT